MTGIYAMASNNGSMNNAAQCRPRRVAMAALLALSIALQPSLVAANPLPELGDASSDALSEHAERELGAKTMAQLRSSGAVLDDPEVTAYLQSLGQRLAASDRAIAGAHFEFFAVPDRSINAFALPGGYIGVNTGLILTARSESELAAVLAHEIIHVSQRHIARQVQAQSGSQLLSLAAMLAGLVAASTGNGQVAQAAIAGATAGTIQSQLNYTRAHEREADRIGFELLVGAGLDPAAMANFFRRLQQHSRTRESSLPGYLRSHPLTHERIAEAQNRALSARYRQVVDSPDFALVQGLLKSYRGDSAAAVERLEGELASAGAAQAPALHYGLAAALLRHQAFDRAMAHIGKVGEAGLRHPMVEALAGQILHQAGRHDEAIARYRSALEDYPHHRQLQQDYPRALLRAGRHAEAASFARQQLARLRGNEELHLVAAEADAKLGRTLSSHYHQGEAYAARGNLGAAVEQLEIALKAAGGDEITRQIAESRLREMRVELRRSTPGAASASPQHLRPARMPDQALPLFTSR